MDPFICYGDGPAFMPEMKCFKGTYVTIAELSRDGYYHIKEDDGDWEWTDAMFVHAPKEKELLLGVSPDEPTVVNEHGGRQSDTPYAFHMIPASAIFGAAKVCGYGAKKYGETFEDRNYTKIPTEEHINHAIQHLYAYLAGDKQDDHLGHAVVRCMFAYDTAKRKGD